MLSLEEIKAKLRKDSNLREAFVEAFSEEVDVDLGDGEVLKFFKGVRDYSDYNIIFKLEDRLFRVTGYYDSWSGRSFEDPIGSLEEGEEVEEIIKVYQPKRNV